MVDFNPFDYAFHEDPYPVYAALRREAPVYHNPSLGFWAFARHADVLAAFKDWQTYSNKGGVSLEQGANEAGDTTAFLSMLGMDPPRHDGLRSLVSRGFTPRRVNALEPRIRELAIHYIERFRDRGECDFVAEFAGKLPMDVVSEMVGVPEADRDMLRSWADQVLHREEGVMGLPEAATQAAAKLYAYYVDLVKERKQKPGEDLVSALLDTELEGKRLGDTDVIGFLFLMIVAGNETTTKLLANALYWADRNPDEREKVRRDESAIPRWVEETLRYDNSTQLLARTITRDHEVGGHLLREGEKALLLVGSANRDEEVWERADVYDIDRDTSASLSFGRGTHFCLGASLARLEARISLEELQRRVPEIHVRHEGLVRVHSTNVRGFAALPIEFATGGERASTPN
ncbi:MAG: cytochrome P450 [Deltaproteobacteria bacterium]|nr:cytochrome P450 [Deltaproteobacteria bacterium]MBW2396711.1 cytochrome P450 [Deltaproteobacteria bacterium]